MESAEFDQIVSSCRTKHPLWFEGDIEAPATEAELAAFEEAVGAGLPTEYKHLGGRYGFGHFAFTNILSVREGDWSIRAAQLYLPKGFIPASDNECGDFYGFVVEDGICKPELYFADHEENYRLFLTNHKNLFEYVVDVGLKP
ncbi:SMI1/KNR4 family protein [Marinobacter hydrocarbonoclasticus]|uniref:SMI1/KNR4 family protein n=1 Tax=Marinobacter nauticus TaxID=2743 RepID=UPI001A8C6A0B|nr:SMI1/KNR4 family protein [Marinobacter nauticus]MBN8241369.1 SMI1/KNR4 family protein [Marinobacter nauticus]